MFHQLNALVSNLKREPEVEANFYARQEDAEAVVVVTSVSLKLTLVSQMSKHGGGISGQ